jgi:hypothetical protein
MQYQQHQSSNAALLWKVPAIAALYFVGILIAGALVTALGLPFPEVPGQTWIPILGYLTAVTLSLGIALLARGLAGTPFKRGWILLVFFYVAFVINNQIEAVVYTTNAEPLTMLLFFVLPCLMAAATAVFLIRSPDEGDVLPTVFADRPITKWWWRVVLAWIAFPFIYYFFGALIYPLVADAYTSPDFGLRVPGPLVVVGAVSLRSLLFLVVTIPILTNWRGSRRSLVLSLTVALAAIVGVAGMFESTWMPLRMKLVHGPEIIADSFVHAWVLVALLLSRKRQESDEPAAAPTDHAVLQ